MAAEMAERVAKALGAAAERQFSEGRADIVDVARTAIAAMRIPTKEMVEIGAVGIMNERLAQKGHGPLPNLDMMFPETLLELIADSKAAYSAMINAALED